MHSRGRLCHIFVAVLVAVTAAVYWPVGGYGFINFGRPPYVTENWHVQGGLTWNGFIWAMTTMSECNWHPLTWLSHMADCQLFGPGPGRPDGAAAAAVLLVITALVIRARLRPDWPLAMGNAAWVMATASDERLRDGPEAVRLAERACRLTGGTDANLLATLAVAYAEAGRFPEAVEAARRALDLARPRRKNELVELLPKWLQLFRSGPAYHEPPLPEPAGSPRTRP